MRKPALLLTTAGLLVLAGFLAWTLWRGRSGEADPAIAKIEALGGWVERDDSQGPVVAVSLSGTRATDADLEALGHFPQLQRLYLGGTEISSAGLAHLRSLTSLRELYLLATRIDDAGLEHLRGLSRLRTLDVSATPVTAAGLKQLRSLPALEVLAIADTRVAPEEVQSLRQALPELRVLFTTF
jgi:hypothetical protein